MLPRLALPTGLLVFALFASPAHAIPVYFTIDQCADGDCSAFDQSGRGAIVAALDVINGNDLLITLTNALNAVAANDNPHLTNIGFEYSGLLSGLTFDSFTVLSGRVAQPTFTVDSSIRSFFIDFGFRFAETRDSNDWFQANDPNETVQIVVGTTGTVNVSDFLLGIAKVGGAGTSGTSGAIVLTGTPSETHSIPEPGSLALVTLGLAFAARRTRAIRS